MRSFLLTSVALLSASCVIATPQDDSTLRDPEPDPAVLEDGVPDDISPQAQSKLDDLDASITKDPVFATISSEIAALPTSVLSQLANIPDDFVSVPAGLSSLIPEDVIIYVSSIENQAANIISDQFITALPSLSLTSSVVSLATPTAGASGISGISGITVSTGQASPTVSAGQASPTAGASGINGTKPSSGQASPTAEFPGAASSLLLKSSGSIGAAAAFIGAACWLLV